MWNFGNCLVLLFFYNPYNQCNSFNIQNPVNTMFGGLWFENAMYFTNEKNFLVFRNYVVTYAPVNYHLTKTPIRILISITLFLCWTNDMSASTSNLESTVNPR